MNINDKMKMAMDVFGRDSASDQTMKSSATAVSDSQSGQVDVMFHDGSVVTIPTIAPVESGENVDVIIREGMATCLGTSGWGDKVSDDATEAQATANAAQTAADEASAKTKHISFDETRGLDIFSGDTPDSGSDININDYSISFNVDSQNIGTMIPAKYVSGMGDEFDIEGLSLFNQFYAGPEEYLQSSIESWIDRTSGQASAILEAVYTDGNEGKHASIWCSASSYEPWILIFKGDRIGYLDDWVAESGLSDTVFRTAALTDYPGIDKTGWSYERYASGKFHATAIIRWRAAMTTSHQGWYRSAPMYAPLPLEASRLLSVQYGTCMGGSDFGEVFVHAGGSIASWDGSQQVHSIPFLGFARNSTATPTGDRWFYTPVDIWGVE